MTEPHRPIVAIVDDDEAVRDSLQFLLETAGYHVVVYDSARAYLDHHALYPADCLVVDQHMPHLTGVELLSLLQQSGASVATVLMTGSPSPELARRAKAFGAARVLEKPLAADALLCFVRQATATR